VSTRSVYLSILLLLLSLRAESSERLWEMLAAQEAARGAFLQELYDEGDELLERSSGRYAVLRPHFFRWEIDYPDRQRIVVAGDVLWHYDIDLQTATRRSTGEEQQFAPLQLLGGDLRDLRQQFRVEDLGGDRYRLQPTYPDAGFASVDLQWESGQITAMEVVDRSGQRLQLSLTPERPTPPLAPADFAFSVPEGVEVYGDGDP
jgi:chaperone LolA